MAPAERMPLAEQKAEMLLERIRSAECPPGRPLSSRAAQVAETGAPGSRETPKRTLGLSRCRAYGRAHSVEA